MKKLFIILLGVALLAIPIIPYALFVIAQYQRLVISREDMIFFSLLYGIPLVYLFLCWMVVRAARRRGRSTFAFSILSLFFTPLLAYLILLLMGYPRQAVPSQR